MRIRKLVKDESWYLLFILPALCMFVFAVIIPLIQGFVYTLTNWDGVSNSFKFVGLANFINLFSDSNFRLAVSNTFKFAICVTILQNLIGLVLALALDASKVFKKLFRTIYFMPSAISVILAGFIWNTFYSKGFPKLLSMFGVNDVNSPLGDPKWVIPAIILVQLWQWSGQTMLIYIAGLQNIPEELKESAQLDGASGWQIFRNITLPLLGPSITINMVLVAMSSLKVFDLVYVTSNGGPGFSSDVLSLTIYRETFTNHLAGYGQSMAFVFFIIILVVSIIQITILRKREVEI